MLAIEILASSGFISPIPRNSVAALINYKNYIFPLRFAAGFDILSANNS